MLAEPERTRYDLTFRLFGFPVRVSPWFWLLSALLGADALQVLGVVYWLVWIVVAFVSILIHELGHSLAFRWFGTDSHIVLYSFGGLAIPWSPTPGRWRRIIVSLAGPVAGFILAGAIYFSHRLRPWAGESPQLAFLYLNLLYVNLIWGLVNLLPVYPLDGGRVSEEICSGLSRRNGLRIALQISIVVAGLFCIYNLVGATNRRSEWLDQLPWWMPRGTLWGAILFAMLAYNSYQLLQQQRWAESHWDDDRPPWAR